MKALGYIGAFLGGAIAGSALGLIFAPRRVRIHVARLLMQLTISAASITSNSAKRMLMIW